jgi:hypothetical protein
VFQVNRRDRQVEVRMIRRRDQRMGSTPAYAEFTQIRYPNLNQVLSSPSQWINQQQRKSWQGETKANS